MLNKVRPRYYYFVKTNGVSLRAGGESRRLRRWRDRAEEADHCAMTISGASPEWSRWEVSGPLQLLSRLIAQGISRFAVALLGEIPRWEFDAAIFLAGLLRARSCRRHFSG